MRLVFAAITHMQGLEVEGILMIQSVTMKKQSIPSASKAAVKECLVVSSLVLKIRGDLPM